MDILYNQFMSKMNNNISGLHCNPYQDHSETSRVPVIDSKYLPVSPTKRKHHENKASDEEQMNKMRCILASRLGNPNGDIGNQESCGYGSFEHTSLNGFHNHQVFAPFPIFAVDQPLEMSRHSVDPMRSMLLIPGSSTKPQQNRPSVITCAPASNRPCSLSSCHMSPNSGTSGSTNKTNGSSSRALLTDYIIRANTMCDPVIEEHFRRSLGKIYEQPVAVSDSVSITGSVDDHFTKALGDAWLQIKAKGSGGAAQNHDSQF